MSNWDQVIKKYTININPRVTAVADNIYQATITGNRSYSARQLVSERTGVPPEKLKYGATTPGPAMVAGAVAGSLMAIPGAPACYPISMYDTQYERP